MLNNNFQIKKCSRFLCGFVVRIKNSKTIIVKIVSSLFHKKFKKILFKSNIFHVHDEFNFTNVGDKVLIKECSPISKLKNFVLVDIIKKKKLLNINMI